MPKRDYHLVNHASLLNQRRVMVEKEEKSFRKMIFIFIFLIIIIITLIYGLFFSSFFQIKKITITGIDRVGEMTQIEKITQELLVQKRFYFLSQKNIFILSKSGLKNIINQNFDLEQVDLIIKLPDTLKIVIKNKGQAMIWQEGNNYFVLDKQGMIKSKIDNIQPFELPVANRGTTTEVIIGQQYLSPEQVNYSQKLFALFNFYFKDLNVKQFVISSLKSREIKLITNKGWYILFNLDLDAQVSLETAKAVLEQKIDDSIHLQYLDVRIKDRVYYQ